MNLLFSCSFAKSKSSCSTKCALTWAKAIFKTGSGRTSSAFGADVSRIYAFSKAVLFPTNDSLVSRLLELLLFMNLPKVESSTTDFFCTLCFGLSLCSTNRCCIKGENANEFSRELKAKWIILGEGYSPFAVDVSVPLVHRSVGWTIYR